MLVRSGRGPRCSSVLVLAARSPGAGPTQGASAAQEGARRVPCSRSRLEAARTSPLGAVPERLSERELLGCM